MAYTLTYSESVKGWPSFYSFYPEMMVGMNNYFYSFKGGNLYRHNTGSQRNTYYDALTPDASTITGVINDSPSTVKKFKTISLEGTDAWDCTVLSDLESGYIDSTWFSLKEGDYYGFIRRNQDDNVFEARSAQGIGSVDTVDSSVTTAVELNFTFTISSMISVGDKVYKIVGGSPTVVGLITSISGSQIIVDADASGIIPLAGDYLFCVKDNKAESYGTTGYFLKYTLSNTSSNFVELYGIGSSLFKSFP
jgi:hypothetical protein